MSYRELNGEAYTRLRKRLLRDKGSPLQYEFINALKDSDDFLAWLDEQEVKVEVEGNDFEVVSELLTENEFKEQPATIESELFEKWHSVTPAQACRATFWGYITRLHIEGGRIQSYFLAANGGSLPGGLERIESAIKDGSTSRVDEIVRTALRRFSGLPEARGNRTVYVDCPFARAWWRGHLAKQVCDLTNADADKVRSILRTSQAYWESLVSSVVSKNSVFGNESIRASLIWALTEKKDFKGSPISTGKGLESVIKQIGIRLAWQELAIIPTKDLKYIFEENFL